jgi:hypothetical protein
MPRNATQRGDNMYSSTLGLGLGSVALVLCTACGAARQQLMGQPVHQQVAILVSTSAEVNAADEAGGVATLAETVSDGLKELGIDSQIYASKYDHPKPPLIRLDVRYWRNPGNGLARDIGRVGLSIDGGNGIIVDCSLYLPNRDKRVFFRRYERSGYGAFVSHTADTSSAASAGDAIVSDLSNPE